MTKPNFLPLALGVGILLIAASATSAKEKKPAPAPTLPGAPPFPGVPTVPGGIPGIPGGIPGVPGGIPGVPGSCALDAHMPESHKQTVNAMILKQEVPASALVAAAQIAEANGFPMAGQCLRQEAARRGGPQEPAPGFDPMNPATWGQAIPGGIPGMPPLPGQPQPGQPAPGQPAPGPTAPAGWDPMDPSTWQIPGWTPGTQPGGQGPGIPGFPGGIPGVPSPQPTTPPPAGPNPIPGFPTFPGPSGQGGIGPMPYTIRAGDQPFVIAAYYTGDGSRFHELEAINPHLGDYTGGQPPYLLWEPGVSIFLPEGWDAWSKNLPPQMPGY